MRPSNGKTVSGLCNHKGFSLMEVITAMAAGLVVLFALSFWALAAVLAREPYGIVFSGGPPSAYEEGARSRRGIPGSAGR